MFNQPSAKKPNYETHCYFFPGGNNCKSIETNSNIEDIPGWEMVEKYSYDFIYFN